MNETIICPNCGAQTPMEIQKFLVKCHFCGSSFSVEEAGKDLGTNSTSEIGYTPDPPPPYSSIGSEETTPEPLGDKDVVVNLSQEEGIPPPVVTVIDTGRRISRVFIIGLAIILILCSLCIILGNFQK